MVLIGGVSIGLRQLGGASQVTRQGKQQQQQHSASAGERKKKEQEQKKK